MDPENKHIDPVGLLPMVFSGEASPKEKELVNNWMNESESNRAEYEAFARLWDIAGAATGEIDIEKEWRKINAAIDTPSRRMILISILRIAAAVLLISLATYAGIRFSAYKTAGSNGVQIKDITLADGSIVSLNTGSSIRYKKGFGTTHRNLTLKGEAYFEVRKAEIPFTIAVEEATVRVTGTKFNVKANHNQSLVKVSVVEGTVSFFETGRPLNSMSITAGETGLFDEPGMAVRKMKTLDVNDLSWKTGIIEFYNTPLSRVAEIFSNTYHIPVTVDAAVINCTVTVRFENQQPDSVLHVLQSTLDLTVTKKGKRIIITGKGC